MSSTNHSRPGNSARQTRQNISVRQPSQIDPPRRHTNTVQRQQTGEINNSRPPLPNIPRVQTTIIRPSLQSTTSRHVSEINFRQVTQALSHGSPSEATFQRHQNHHQRPPAPVVDTVAFSSEPGNTLFPLSDQGTLKQKQLHDKFSRKILFAKHKKASTEQSTLLEILKSISENLENDYNNQIRELNQLLKDNPRELTYHRLVNYDLLNKLSTSFTDDSKRTAFVNSFIKPLLISDDDPKRSPFGKLIESVVEELENHVIYPEAPRPTKDHLKSIIENKLRIKFISMDSSDKFVEKVKPYTCFNEFATRLDRLINRTESRNPGMDRRRDVATSFENHISSLARRQIFISSDLFIDEPDLFADMPHRTEIGGPPQRIRLSTVLTTMQGENREDAGENEATNTTTNLPPPSGDLIAEGERESDVENGSETSSISVVQRHLAQSTAIPPNQESRNDNGANEYGSEGNESDSEEGESIVSFRSSSVNPQISSTGPTNTNNTVTVEQVDQENESDGENEESDASSLSSHRQRSEDDSDDDEESESEEELENTNTHASSSSPAQPDWHMEFYMDGERINLESTIYSAIYKHLLRKKQERLTPEFWSGEFLTGEYEIQFKKVKSTPPPSQAQENSDELEIADVAKGILEFMDLLHSLYEETVFANKYDPTLFLCQDVDKLIIPLLKDPLSVLTKTFPDFHLKICTRYRFLMSAKRRHEFFLAKTFGLRDFKKFDLSDEEKRLISPVVPEQKRVSGLSKPDLFRWFCKNFPQFATTESILKVTFTGERGVGEGVAREFYAVMSLEFSQVCRNMWLHDSEAGAEDTWIKNVNGLYPALMDEKMMEEEEGKEILHNFRLLGQFVAKAIVDGRVVDLPFNKIFVDLLLHPNCVLKSLDTDCQDLSTIIEAIQSVYPSFGKTLQNLYANPELIAGSCIPYDIPVGRPTKSEIDHGSDTQFVTCQNINSYILSCKDWIFDRGVRRQIEAFKEGFNRVFSFESLREYSSIEFAQLILFQVDEDWSIETVRKHVKLLDASSINEVDKVIQIMSKFDSEDKKRFLRFVTGSPKLPIGGFQALEFKISTREKNSYPQGRTCFNTFMVPRDNPEEELMQKIKLVIEKCNDEIDRD
ncbi:16078_t:CDS:2 [Acaulospora colombiana]|uniref:16078_t:CDS:1 n=1 Tax=Acaulospora colombiana TaxID=27376 RepID=A0ACA9KER4_9GLOM|nr:16078_t:CDS:2 [Acaulospora colombiana]